MGHGEKSFRGSRREKGKVPLVVEARPGQSGPMLGPGEEKECSHYEKGAEDWGGDDLLEKTQGAGWPNRHSERGRSYLRGRANAEAASRGRGETVGGSGSKEMHARESVQRQPVARTEERHVVEKERS